MRNTVVISIALTVLAFFIAIIWSVTVSHDNEIEVPDSPPPPDIDELIPDGVRADKDVTVDVLIGEELVSMPMERFLIGVVASEMPASFEKEALKAQAVAARTDTMYNMYISRKPRHPEADVCADYSCCMAYQTDEELRLKWGSSYVEYISKIIGAVIETDGVYITYEGLPILAVFHSSSAGMTENSGNVWSVDLPYLTSVKSPETPEEVPNYISTVTISQSDFKETVSKAIPEAVFGDDPQSWITDITRTVSGRIESVMLGGVTVSGTGLRSMFQLRSTAAQIDISGGDVVFTTTGYGHGVGMSQYGANSMAKKGKNYRDILAVYYTGVMFVGGESLIM